MGILAPSLLQLRVFQRSIPAQQAILEQHRQIFRKAESSAWSIANSCASASIRHRDSISTVASVELTHVPLSIDDELFRAPVYKRLFIDRLRQRRGNAYKKSVLSPRRGTFRSTLEAERQER